MVRAYRHFGSCLHTSYEYLAMVFGLGALSLLCLLGIPAAVPLLLLPTNIRIPLGRRVISSTMASYLWILKTFCGVKIEDSALQSISSDYPLIVIANHPSLLDAVILLAQLPQASCVMKASLRWNLLFGPMARLSGYISNEDPKHMIMHACKELKAGSHIVIFPEGTRTITQPINEFGQTCALIATRSNTQVQTVFIEFSTLYLGKNWPIWRKPTLPLRINLRLGHKFDVDKDRFAFTETLESYYREQLTRE
jgi:1-acyl-sn-glycerol-3-phosphate acyltransferase